MSKQKQKNNTMYPKINKSLNSTFRRKQYEQIEE